MSHQNDKPVLIPSGNILSLLLVRHSFDMDGRADNAIMLPRDELSSPCVERRMRMKRVGGKGFVRIHKPVAMYMMRG